MATRMDKLDKRINYKDFFPDVKERLNMNINLTENFTEMVTSHG
jgi:hypothetical protein